MSCLPFFACAALTVTVAGTVSSVKLATRREASRVLFEGPFRTNPADPASFALSDHLPVMATFAQS